MTPAFRIGALAIALLGPVAAPARAASTTATFAVNVLAPATCALTANPLVFPTYAQAISTATTTLSIICSTSTPYSIGLSSGTTSGATVSNRLMTASGVATLHYGLFQDTTHSLNWGETVNTDTVQGIGTGAAQTVTIFALIPAGQFITPGSYSDTVTATVTY